MNSYIDDRLDDADKEMKCAEVEMKVAFKMIEFKHELFEKIAKMQLDKTLNENDLGYEKRLISLNDMIKNNYMKKKNEEEIIKLVQDELRIRHIKDYEITEKIVYDILHMKNSSDLISFVRKYKKAVDNYRKYQTEKLKKLDEKKLKAKEEVDSKPTTIESNISYGSSEDMKENLIKEIEIYINDGNKLAMPNALKTKIERAYPNLNNYDSFYSYEILYEGIELSNIEHRKKFMDIEITKAAILTYKILTEYLISGYSSSSSPKEELFNRFNIKDSLKKYEQIYDKYMKFYNSLSKEEKENILNRINNNSYYKSLFGEGIITPEKLKDKVNLYVKNYIIENKRTFFPAYNEYGKTSHALKYMTPEEVNRVYIGVTANEDYYYSNYMSNEKREKYQTMFAKIVLNKLEEKSNSSSAYHLSNEQQAEIDRKIAAIIVNLFKEEPINKNYQQIAQRDDLTSLYQSLLEQHNSKKNTTPSIFGPERVMNSFKNLQRWALSKMIGTDQDSNQDTYQGGYTKK